MKKSLLGVFPVVIDRAEEESGDVVVDTTLIFAFSGESCLRIGKGTAIEPFGNDYFQSARVVATCVVSTGLQLKGLSEWTKIMWNGGYSPEHSS
jgi:hypothetical protein